MVALPTTTACMRLYTPTTLISLCFSKQAQLLCLCPNYSLLLGHPLPVSSPGKLLPTVEIPNPLEQTEVNHLFPPPSAFLVQQAPVPGAGTADRTPNSKLPEGNAGSPPF